MCHTKAMADAPALATPVLPEIPSADVAPDADFSTVKEKDTLMYNAMIKTVGASLPFANDIDAVCKAALTVGKLLQLRRRMMCYPDAYKGSSDSDALVLPID